MYVSSPLVDKYIIRSVANASDGHGPIGKKGPPFIAPMRGGTVTALITGRMTGFASSSIADNNVQLRSAPYTFSVRRIGSTTADSWLVPNGPPVVTNQIHDTQFMEWTDFTNSPATMSYIQPTSMSYDVINNRSYADIRFTNLRTFSGDIKGVRVYYKPVGDIGNYTLLVDAPLEARELLVDPFSLSGFVRTGYFKDQPHVSKYWRVKQGANAGYYRGNETGTTITSAYSNLPIDSLNIWRQDIAFNLAGPACLTVISIYLFNIQIRFNFLFFD